MTPTKNTFWRSLKPHPEIRPPTVSMERPSELKPNSKNPRTHSDEQIELLARNFRKFGFRGVVVIDEGKTILSGHGRVRAAQLAGINLIPCTTVDDLTEKQKLAYLVADNRLAEKAGWNIPILQSDMIELSDENALLEIETPTITGFDSAEIDIIVNGGDVRETGLERATGERTRRSMDCADVLDEADLLQSAAITKPGDLWRLGSHRLYCGDALSPGDLKRVLAAESGMESVDAVFTDPPFNVPITGHVGNKGKKKHREFIQASGEMTADQFAEFLTRAVAIFGGTLRRGGIAFVVMDWRHIVDVYSSARSCGLEVINLCVWVKPVGGMGSLYRSRHELIAVLRRNGAPHRNNVQLGSKGRYRTNVWEYPGIVGSGSRGREQLAMHPTVKPVALVTDALRDVTSRGDVVLDPFAGSGTTLLAAERIGRRARLIELDPLYCDLIIRRWSKLTGEHALLAGTGTTFDELEGAKGQEPMRTEPL